MEFEDQEEDGLGLGPSYDESTRTKMGAPPPLPLRKSRYKECLKNQAVGIGGHAVDGCGEFIAAGEDGTLESLKCAACNCHRNFHRKEPGGGFFAFHSHFGYRAPSGYLHVAPSQRTGGAMLALPSSSAGGGGADEMDAGYYSNPSSSAGKKRFRTKFSQEQKDKMLNFAERLEWKIQKQDEELVQQFCNELGIKRHVLKVWMHNNKHTIGKKI
ncbi:hypothetical protein ACS0TY_031556 [Phlomoides rotata]